MAFSKVQQQITDSSSASGSSATSNALASSPTDGNLLLFFVWFSFGAGAFSGSGMTNISSHDTPEPNGIGVLWKIAASDPTTHTITSANSNPSTFFWEIVVQEWSGGDTTTPIDVKQTSWTDIFDSADIVEPSITTVTANALDVALVQERDSGPGYGMVSPAGVYTEEVDSKAFGIYTKVIASAGATGTRTMSHPVFQQTASFSCALRPPSGPPVSPVSPVSWLAFPKFLLRRA
jgi:hypothetical protein